MIFQRYTDIKSFSGDVSEVLYENEIQNNMIIGFTHREMGSDWFLASVKDGGSVVLAAACTPPHNITLYSSGNRPNDGAVAFLCKEINALNIKLPGVLAERGLARRFAETYSADSFYLHHSLVVMQLISQTNVFIKASGSHRLLNLNDLHFVPYWRSALSAECNIHAYSIEHHAESIPKQVEAGTHYIWEDSQPVSMAHTSRRTRDGASIAGVYTPPHFRGKGYATSVVAQLSQDLLDRGNKFCFLFADASNPVSCGMYRKIGYNGVCEMDEYRFGVLQGE
jgi:hypothetical protein